MANRPRSSDEDSGDGEGRVTKRPRPSLEGVDQPADQSPKEVFKPLASTQDVYDEESWPNWTRINRVAGYDYLSLVRRSLASLGFEDIAEELTVADRKWVDYEDDPSNELREHVLNGDWDAAWKEGFGIFRCAGMDEDEAQFLILKQKYVELVHSDRQAALKCLRSEIVPLGVHPSRVQKLAAMLLEPLDEGHSGHSPEEGRRKLLETLASFEEPPSWMIAWTLAKPDRLEELVEQAVIAQMAKCHLHNSARPQKISLLQDYTCGTEQIPQHPMPGVMRHVSEVWHVAFSHSGHAFISVGKDCQAMVWAVEGRKAPSLMCSFTMHHEPITYAAWSPDDSRVVTCDQLGWLFVWSPTVDGAKFITLVRQHDLAATCAAWLPGGKYLVTVSHDEYLCITDSDTGMHIKFCMGQRIHDLVLVNGGGQKQYALAVTSQRTIKAYDLSGWTEFLPFTYGSVMLQDCVIQALPLSFNSPEGGVLSIAITRCQRHLVAVLDGGCLCMWDMGVNAQMLNLGGGLLQNGHFAIPRLPRQVSPRVLPRPGGEPPQNKFIVRCCFGGLDERFILSGSESGQVRVYSRITQDLLLELPGHQGTVNAVSWNPARPDMFVSCSDDGTVRMWGVENDQTEEMEHDRVLPETTSPAC